MRNVCLVGLILANLAALCFLLSVLSTGQATQLTIDDLSYGAIDLDGDGSYSIGDDRVVEWYLDNRPEALEESLKTARVNTDGGVDLSSYFMSEKFDGILLYHERFAQNQE